jgi:branched-chain amino acid transport system substrate-binding protein
LRTTRPKTVAILHENALAPTAFGQSAEAAARRLGFRVVYKESFPQGADFAPIMSALKARKPDVVLTGGYTLGMITLVRQAAEQDVRVPMWMFMLGPTVPGFLQSVKRLGEYLLEPVQWAPNFNPKLRDEIFGWNARQFAREFKRDIGYVPDYHPPQSAAALEVYYKAIRQAGSLDRKKVRDKIARIRLRSFYGNVCFNAKGVEACKSMGIIQIQGGRTVVVWPKKFAQAKLVYPAPGF